MQKYVFRKYSDKYPFYFQNEKTALLKVLSVGMRRNLCIEHVGSTSVEGLGGKGVIDVLIGVKRFRIEDMLSELRLFGYDFKEHASSQNRKFLQKDYQLDGEVQRFHIHLIVKDNPEWKNMLAFRDYLRMNSSMARKYEKVKKKALGVCDGEKKVYVKLKKEILQNILDEAINYKF